jgi:hypothetical protein
MFNKQPWTLLHIVHSNPTTYVWPLQPPLYSTFILWWARFSHRLSLQKQYLVHMRPASTQRHWNSDFHTSNYTNDGAVLFISRQRLLNAKEKERRSSIVYRSKEKENYGLIYERKRRKTRCRLPKPEPNAEYQCRALLDMGQARPMGAVSHRPHDRARQHRTLGKPPGQIPSQQMQVKWLYLPQVYLHTFRYGNSSRWVQHGGWQWCRRLAEVAYPFQRLCVSGCQSLFLPP